MKKLKSISSRVAQNQVSGTCQNYLSHPNCVFYFNPPKSTNVPELDYNNTSYYVDMEDLEMLFPLDEAIKTDLNFQVTAVMDKLPYTHENFPCAIMATTEGNAAAAHRPLIRDQPHMHLGFWRFLDWCSNQLREQLDWKLYPTELLAVVDPVPDIDVQDLPIYNIPAFDAHIFIASYSDTIHIMRAEDFFYSLNVRVSRRFFWGMSRAYTDISVEGQKKFEGVPNTIPRGLIVSIWNAKSMTRPSFKATFLELFATHHPALLIVTEARISDEHCQELITTLPGKYESAVFDNIDQCGGVVLMWRVNDLFVSYKEDDSTAESGLFNFTFEVKSVQHPSFYILYLD